MSTITTLNDWITGASFRWQVNTNFSNLNTDKAETSALTSWLATKQDTLVSGTNIKTVNGNSLLGSGDITISGGGSVATDTIWDAKWDLAGGTGANTASRLPVWSNWQVLTADSAEATGMKWSNPAGGGDALTSGTLAQFASTTSLQLKWVISDETGSWSLVFANSPTLVTPALGVATATSINGASIISWTLDGSVTWTNTGDQTSIVGITGTKAQFDTAVTDGNIVYVWDTATSTNALQSATTTVSVSGATAPSTWQVLTATSSTTATWQTISGTGDVTSASNITDNAIVRWDWGAKWVQSSWIIIDDSNNISIPWILKQWETSARTWWISTRDHITTFPVPCIRPNTTNSTIAFDIIPNWTPADFWDNWVAWFDVCNTDTLSWNVAVSTARVWIRSDAVEFGSRVFSGWTVKPLYITMNASNAIEVDTSWNTKIVWTLNIQNVDTSITRVSAWVIAVEGATIPSLTSTSTFSTGIKTFLAWMFALRNVANTFSGFFTNTNTADRTYTLQDRNGTLADNTDLALKANLASPTFTGTVVFPSGQALIAPVLGTPTSGTLTNCTWLPLAWVVDSTTEALGVWSLEVWHASDTTITRVSAGVIAVEGVTIPTNNTAVLSIAWTPTWWDRITNIISLTTAEYTAATKDSATLYIITD